MKRISLAALAAFAAVLALAPDARAAEPLYGRRIGGLRFAGDAPVDEVSLGALTDLRSGQTLTEDAVRTAMRNLFATRRFSDLAIEAAPQGEGALVLVRFSAAPRIADVALFGVRLADRSRVRDVLSLETGENWSPERGKDAERGLRRVLRERGWFAPSVEMHVEPGPDDSSVNVVFRVEPGPRARVGPTRFSGNLAPFTAEEITARMKLRPGGYYRQSRARDDADRLTEWLHRKDFARAEVRFEGETYDDAARTAVARYAVFVGPKVVLHVAGASVSSVRKHPESPWSRGEPPDEEAVRRLRDALVRTYQQKGYARVEVSASLHTEPGEDRIDVLIRKGARYSVDRVEFDGVHSIPKHELASLLKTRRRGLVATGRVVDHDLEEDRGTLGAIYSSRGFPDVAAGKPRVADGKRPFTLDVTFPVEEGAPVLVAARRVEGNVRVPTETLLKLLSVAPGQPYTRSSVGADEAVLQGWYLSHGYPEARVTTEALLEPPVPPRPLAATIVYHVFEGDAVVFGKSVVRGNTRTVTRVVEGEFAHSEGKPFALTRLIDTQQALARLGVFSRIELSFFPTDPKTRSRTVIVSLAESKPWSLVYGVGAEYDQHAERRFNPRLSLGVTYGNLFGRALVASAEGRWSVRDKRVVGTLRDPTLFSAKVPVSFAIFRADQTFENYEVARRGAFLEAEHRFGTSLRAALRYQYEIVNPTAPPEVLTTLERQNQAEAISSIGPSLVWDTRGDPIDPHAGILASLDVKYAFSFISANARFLRGLVQAAVYRPFAGTVLVVSARAGAIQSHGTCDVVAHPTCPPNLEIPIVERFFAGGRTSHRAFPLDQLGIPGQTLLPDANGNLQASGGNGLLLGNFEWRIPVVGELGISFFLDSGNVWADYRRMKLSELRTGAGIGLHYLTPVGPMRLEYGWKLDRREGESAGELSFSVGYPF